MRANPAFDRGFLGGAATAALFIGVTLLLVGAWRRARERRVAGTPIGIDSIAPGEVELGAQPAPEASSGASTRLESEMDDVMLPSQRW